MTSNIYNQSQLKTLKVDYNHNVGQKRVFSNQELASLLSVLSEDVTRHQSFEQLSISLRHYFPNKADHFKIGLKLVTLLQNLDLLPSATQRLTAIYFLYDIYSHDPIYLNPFASVFVHLLHCLVDDRGNQIKNYLGFIPKISQSEIYFISQLISQPSKELSKKTPNQIVQMDVSKLPPIDTSSLQLLLVERQSEMAITSRCAISCILPNPDYTPQTMEQLAKPGILANLDLQRQTIESLFCNPDLPYSRFLQPQFITLVPPLHTSLDEELVWLDVPPCDHLPMWDESQCSNNSTSSEARRLINKAFSGSLLLHQQQQLLNMFKTDSKLVYHVGVTPAKFPALVENNPLIAIEVLLNLMQSNQITEYFSVLVNMDISLHSMEVVNRLTTSVELPFEFIHLYISNCISSCDSIKDKFMQNRLVRLVCVFLQSLIRNKLVDIKDIYIEVQAFCIEYSRIREAGALFRLLKTLEGNDQNASSTGTNNNNSSNDGGGNSKVPGATESKPNYSNNR